MQNVRVEKLLELLLLARIIQQEEHCLRKNRLKLGQAAIRAGVGFVLYDWMYHHVTDEQPMNLNSFLDRLMKLIGVT